MKLEVLRRGIKPDMSAVYWVIGDPDYVDAEYFSVEFHDAGYWDIKGLGDFSGIGVPSRDFNDTIRTIIGKILLECDQHFSCIDDLESFWITWLSENEEN